jgi:hypothetical protein
MKKEKLIEILADNLDLYISLPTSELGKIADDILEEINMEMERIGKQKKENK